MKISDKAPEVLIFEEIDAGDVFRYTDGELYMKTVDADDLNAVCLEDGDIYMIPRKAEVKLVKGTFLVE